MKRMISAIMLGLLASALLCAPAFGQSCMPTAPPPVGQDLVIKNEVETAVSMLAAIYEKVRNKSMTLDKAKALGADLLRELHYGTDGYFWADTEEGVNVVLYGRKDVEGKNRLDAQDAKGKYFVRALLKTAKAGGGYVEYWFPRKGQAEPEPKRSYVQLFAPFGWVVGSGYYFPAPVDQAQAAELTAAIDRAELFSQLTALEKQALQSVARLTHAKAGERIITQGENLDRMYVILNSPSEIRVDGKRIVTNPGQALVGELEFLDAPPATADVIVQKNADLLVLDYKALAHQMEKNPGLGLALMREFARIEARRLRADAERKAGRPAPPSK